MNRSRRCNTCGDNLELTHDNYKQYPSGGYSRKCRICDNKARAGYANRKRSERNEAQEGWGWSGIDRVFFSLHK